MSTHVLNISLNTLLPQHVPSDECSARTWYSLFEDEHGHISTLSYPEREFLKNRIFAEVRKNVSIESHLQKRQPTSSRQKGTMMYVLTVLAILVAIVAVTAFIEN
jgi:hypothetical protein